MDNKEHVKSIVKDINMVVNGEMRRCTNCGTHYYDAPCCPECECRDDEIVDVLDWFSDVLDIEYRLGSDRKLRSVKLLLAWGGPNIWLDTDTNSVDLYWWGDHAEEGLLPEVCEAINEAFEELFNC